MSAYFKLLFWALLVAGGAWGMHTWDARQLAAVKATYDKQIAEASAAAQAQRASLEQQIATAEAERDRFKTNLEKEYDSHQADNDALSRKLASVRLRYRAPAHPNAGVSGATAASAGSSATGPVLQLPDQITADLRQFALDADNLASAYRLCVQDDTGTALTDATTTAAPP